MDGFNHFGKDFIMVVKCVLIASNFLLGNRLYQQLNSSAVKSNDTLCVKKVAGKY